MSFKLSNKTDQKIFKKKKQTFKSANSSALEYSMMKIYDNIKCKYTSIYEENCEMFTYSNFQWVYFLKKKAKSNFSF